MTHDDLIARLEAATEGSRELDWDIAHLLYPGEEPATVTVGPQLPHYTTSLDAALMLVPDGWRWQIFGEGKSSDMDPRPMAMLYGDTFDVDRGYGQPPDQDIEWSEAHAATPTLALCIASLKALAAGGTGD